MILKVEFDQILVLCFSKKLHNTNKKPAVLKFICRYILHPKYCAQR